MAKNPWGPLQTVLWGLWYSIIREKGVHNFFLTGEIAFLFSKNCVFNNLLGPEETIVFFHSNCQSSFLTTRNCPLRLVKLEYKIKKNWPKNFSQWKICLFFKKLCFQQHIKSWRNDLIASTVIVRLVFWPLKTVPWGLSNSNIRERSQSFFLTGNIAFFSKFVFSTTS